MVQGLNSGTPSGVHTLYSFNTPRDELDKPYSALSFEEMDAKTQVQIEDAAVDISHSTYTLRKGMEMYKCIYSHPGLGQ